MRRALKTKIATPYFCFWQIVRNHDERRRVDAPRRPCFLFHGRGSPNPHHHWLNLMAGRALKALARTPQHICSLARENHTCTQAGALCQAHRHKTRPPFSFSLAVPDAKPKSDHIAPVCIVPLLHGSPGRIIACKEPLRVVRSREGDGKTVGGRK